MKFQIYEYIAPGKTEPEEGIPQGDNNMLLYLQMTDKKPFPSAPILPYSGNFVPKEIDGTMCIERGIFWDNYLLRKTAPEHLHTLNHATYAWIQHADVDNTQYPNWEIGVGDSIHSAKPDFFRWEPTTDPLAWKWGLPRKDTDQYYHHETRAGYAYGKLTVDCEFGF